jgi:DNA-binding response OmpR family regulator
MYKKILLAEDSLTIQKVFELALAKSDVALTMIDNGEDAVRLAGEIVPDLVVADVTLPGKDGFQITSDLRASEKTRSVPVLVLAGTVTPFDEERFKACGANGVLFKPFESQQLIDKVEELLGEGQEAPAAETETAEAGAESGGSEPWDFSDVLEDVEAEADRGQVAGGPRGEDLLSAVSAAPGKGKNHQAFGEFDVSLDEIGGTEAAEEAAASPDGEEREDVRILEGARLSEETHLEGDPATDAPPPVTDLGPAAEAVQDLLELDELDEIDLMREDPLTFVPRREEAPRGPEIPHATEEAPAERDEAPPPPAEEERESEPAIPSVLRDAFSARAEEIFREVTAKTVEKVMGEWMDRIAGELSQKIRESVETVAWDVIPGTAEALIREEIARIRAKAKTEIS